MLARAIDPVHQEELWLHNGAKRKMFGTQRIQLGVRPLLSLMVSRQVEQPSSENGTVTRDSAEVLSESEKNLKYSKGRGDDDYLPALYYILVLGL